MNGIIDVATLREGFLIEDAETALIGLALKETQGLRAPAADLLGIGIRTLGLKLQAHPELRNIGRYEPTNRSSFAPTGQRGVSPLGMDQESARDGAVLDCF